MTPELSWRCSVWYSSVQLRVSLKSPCSRTTPWCQVRESTLKALDEGLEHKKIEKAVRRAAGGFVSEHTRRRPMIVPVVIEA